MSKKRTFVYLIACQHTDTVKIGISVTPRARLQQLQTASPFELRLVETWPVSVGQARDIESLLHKRLADRRLKGEWFSSHEEVASVVINVWMIILSEGQDFNSIPDRMKFCGRKYAQAA